MSNIPRCDHLSQIIRGLFPDLGVEKEPMGDITIEQVSAVAMENCEKNVFIYNCDTVNY